MSFIILSSVLSASGAKGRRRHYPVFPELQSTSSTLHINTTGKNRVYDHRNFFHSTLATNRYRRRWWSLESVTYTTRPTSQSETCKLNSALSTVTEHLPKWHDASDICMNSLPHLPHINSFSSDRSACVGRWWSTIWRFTSLTVWNSFPQ